MSLVQDHHVVQTFAADTLDQPFDVGGLSRTPRRDEHFFDPHIAHPLPEDVTVDAIAVTEEIPRGFLPWERVHDLLGRPRGCRMFRHVPVHDLPAFMHQDHEDKEHSVRHGRHDKEIHRDQVVDVVLQECPPCRRRRLAALYSIDLHGRFGYVDAQLLQFPNDPWRAPRRVRLPHRADEMADILGNRRTTGGTMLAQALPVVAKSLALPGDDGTGLNELQGILSGRPEPREPRPE